MKFGLIGHPIRHSLSPELFKAGYEGRYPYELIEGDDFETSYRRFIDSYDGINVTAPFKEQAFAKADILSDECTLIKATNLLVKTPEGIKAYNSDYLGVRLWLSGIMEDSSDKRNRDSTLTVLIAGCGGAGKAAAIAAASLGLRVILMNRNPSKSTEMASTIKAMGNGADAEVRTLDEFKESFREADIIIYNIPTVIPQLHLLEDQDFRGYIQADNGYGPKHILEANYKDPSFDDALIQKMTEANPAASYTKGTVWLLYQAMTGYELFTGEIPDLKKMSDVL